MNIVLTQIGKTETVFHRQTQFVMANSIPSVVEANNFLCSEKNFQQITRIKFAFVSVFNMIWKKFSQNWIWIYRDSGFEHRQETTVALITIKVRLFDTNSGQSAIRLIIYHLPFESISLVPSVCTVVKHSSRPRIKDEQFLNVRDVRTIVNSVTITITYYVWKGWKLLIQW